MMGASSVPNDSAGVAADMARWFLAFVKHGRGVQITYNTQGNSTDFKIAENSDFIFPSLTILNVGSSSIRVGYGSTVNGTKGFLLLGGASLTLKWINPRVSQLVANDMGTAGTEIDVIG